MTQPYDPATLPTHTGAWYVYIRRDQRTGLLAGPYATGAAASAVVERTRDIACQLDPWADFDHFGVCEMPDESRVGILNSRLAAA